ncbi:MAG: hypothetical protein WB778_10300 [Thermoplasmata archaeon]
MKPVVFQDRSRSAYPRGGQRQGRLSAQSFLTSCSNQLTVHTAPAVLREHPRSPKASNFFYDLQTRPSDR